MKETIKLLNTYKDTKKGYLIYLIFNSKNQRKRKCIGYCFKEFWNELTNLPLQQHSDYHNLMPVILEYKAKIAQLSYKKYTIQQAYKYILNDRK